MKIALILLALTVPAWADAPPPPARYDHPFTAQLSIRTVATLSEANELCKQWGPRKVACSSGVLNSHCHIIIAQDSALRAIGFTRKASLRHEIAHCNGWGSDHPK